MIMLFDIGLGALLLYAGWRAAAGRDDFGAIIFYITFGLTVAVAWVRLGAPNVALAEAAIGAGLTGVLLLGMLARLAGRPADKPKPPRPLARVVAAVASAAVALGIALAALGPEMGRNGLAAASAEQLPRLEIDNAVTAALLVFRGYDTLLETVVLLAALVGLWTLTPDTLWGGVPGRRQTVNPTGVLSHFGRFLPPLGILVAVYLWWVGTDAPGGAFQAGTVLAAVAVLGLLAGLGEPPPITSLPVRLALVAGPAVFVFVGLLGAVMGEGFLGYAQGHTKPLLLGLEAALTISIAATLTLLVAGAPERPRP